MTDPTLRAGVVGVGSMGRHHTRVYHELPGVRIDGVSDADADRATEVADSYDTQARPVAELLERVDLVSVAVPTRNHYETARRALDAGVHVLVEKPFVETAADGRRLIERARERDLVLQVGHVERFNPAVQTAADVVEACDLVGLSARRLGPPIRRDISDGVALDLMLHDIDVVLAIVDGEPRVVAASGTRENEYVSAQLQFETGVVVNLVASRLTQRKIRQLEVTASECFVDLDYIDQTVEIHHQSLPEFVETNGNIRYRNESVVEHPTVGNGEPLRNQLASFVSAVREGTTPEVTGADGLRALELAREIDRLARRDLAEVDRS